MLRLRTFGGLSVENGAVPAAGAAVQRSRLAVLAAIVAAGAGGISRDRLLAVFWPESDLGHARGALKQALYALRRDLDQPDLLLGTDDLRLNPAVIGSDVGDFEAALRGGSLERAVGIYQGPFLDGIHLGNGEFSRWRDAEEQRLALRYRQAIEQLARAAEARGDHGAAASWWRLAAAADPFSGSVAVSLMKALVKAGDRAAALKQAMIHEQSVRADLDAEPDPAVSRLVAEIRRAEAGPPEPMVLPNVRGAETAARPARVPNPPIRLPSRRLTLVAAAGLAVAGSAVLMARRLDPDLVQIAVAPRAAPWSDSLFAATVGTELRLRDPTLMIAPRLSRRAQYQVEAWSRIDGDSLYLGALVTDASGRRLGSLGPIATGARAPRAGMKTIGERAAIAIAAARSPLFRRWATAAAIPNTWEAFKALEVGIRMWAVLDSATLARLDRAAALDPTSATPLVWKALTLSKARQFLAADSVLAGLDSSSRRQRDWDRAVVAVVRAWNRDDLTEAHAAGHRLLDVVPGSEWAIVPAYDALGVGRPDEALKLLRQIPTDLDWVRWWSDRVKVQALYHTGDFATALAAATERLRQEPGDLFFQQAAVKALAGLGRVSEVEEICARGLVQRLNDQPCGQAVFELRGRGYRDAARRVADLLLAALRVADTTTAATYHETRVDLACSAGDWPEVERALGGIDPTQIDRLLLWCWAKARAADGDRAAVTQALARLAGTSPPSPLDRAEIAALLGDKAEAVNRIAEAFRTGYRRGFTLFHFAGLDLLHGYPPFESLVRPIDDPEHRARFAAR